MFNAQYWRDGFVLNDLDTCTGYAPQAFSLHEFSGELHDGDTVLLEPSMTEHLRDGVSQPGGPTLSAPGLGNEGSVVVKMDVDDWLRFDWWGQGLDSPSATAVFGRYRGHDRVVSWRETTR